MAENERKSAGDSNRITREYFDSILLETRLMGPTVPSTEFRLFGETFATPIMTAALSHLGGTRKEGMAETARGAHAAGAVHWAGMGDGAELEAMIATGARTVKIIKPYEDNDEIFAKIAHAEASGAFAVGMDIDHWFSATGGHDTVLGRAMRPKSPAEIRSFIESTRLPFVVKGVLSERDAAACLEAGAGGIVVSHHHGIMPFSAPPLTVLPGIARLIAGRIPIFVDCGFESGMDAFKALALGATAVSVGRAVMGPLKERGADGVRDKLLEMTGELAGAMARTGAATLDGIDPSALWRDGKRLVRP